MIGSQGQIGSSPDAGTGVCPQCGALLKGPGQSVVEAVSGTAEPVTVWHRSLPGFGPPPGCRRVWVPLRGYLDVDEDIRKRVDRFFSVPMLTLALLVLPLLVVDYYVTRGGEGKHPRLAVAVLCCHIALSVAFLAEFLVKIKIAQSRVAYLARNWIDLIIIILPFLRPFRVLQAARLYAVRGVGLKAVRTMVPVMLGLRFTQRFRRNAAEMVSGRPDYSKWPRSALLLEVERLRGRLHEAEQRAGRAGNPQAAEKESPTTDAKA